MADAGAGRQLTALQHRCTDEQRARDGGGVALLGLGEHGAAGPAVEPADGRSTPDLVVGLACRLARARPARGHAEVPAEAQGHLVLLVGAPPLGLRGLASLPVALGLLPDLGERAPQDLGLDLLALGGG